ncbi:MAG: phospholipase D family protein [Burkholderiales bacterium]
MNASPRAAFIAVLLGWGPFASSTALSYEASNVVPATGAVEYAFTPGDDATALIVRVIDAARVQILVQAFSFTHREIADALVRAHRRNVEVQVIADTSQIKLIEHNVIPALVEAGVAVFTDSEHTSAHNKVIIADAMSRQPALVTGSFNFTFAAQYRNAENVLVMRGNRELSKAFLDNWKIHRAHAVEMGRTRRK